MPVKKEQKLYNSATVLIMFCCHLGANELTGDGSDLTLGKVICGNPSKALLSRRRLNPDSSGELDNETPEIKFEPKVRLL